jgi:hypothetical protein
MSDNVMRGFWHFSRWAFFAVLSIIVLIGAILLLPAGALPEVGCYTVIRDIGFECQGFLGAETLGRLLNWVVAIFIFFPGIAIYALVTGAKDLPPALWTIPLGSAVLAIYLVALLTPVRWVRRRLN